MLISCRKLKSYIKGGDTIDWHQIWDTFMIRTAEVEKIETKGADLKDVVVAQIVDCKSHPTKAKYHILKVTDGSNTYNILCGAPNVHQGLKSFLVKPGGLIRGVPIEEKLIAGVLSQGMLCAEDELGIGTDHKIIIELPEDAILGTNIKDLWPIEDIIVEIDHKSLTNRPDLWGHYGIAREIAAITGKQLLPLELASISNNLTDLPVEIEEPKLCYRYSALKIANLETNKTPIDIRIFLHYTGFRSISLTVDLTNYVMLELGQPMHAFDANQVQKIEIGLAQTGTSLITLDNVKRILNDSHLMIKNNNKYFAIAGIMGGFETEITSETSAIILESATFDSTSIRKSALALGLRTEASVRYEKSLDPNLTVPAIQRYVYLLSQSNPNLVIASNLTDCYPTKIEPQVISLNKSLLTKYLGFELETQTVKDILTRLGFQVRVTKTAFQVTVPTYRASKDIKIPADLIEEIARMYGYENFEPQPLCLDLTMAELETDYQTKYELKCYLANRFLLNEVHSYIWYDSELLKTLEIVKDNIKIIGKSENNILRDNLALSLLSIVQTNLKHLNKVNLFEIGTVINNNENKLHLAIILADEIKHRTLIYQRLKTIVANLGKVFKNQKVSFKSASSLEPSSSFQKDIIIAKTKVGTLDFLPDSLTNRLAKKKCIAWAEIDYDVWKSIPKIMELYQPPSKYPVTKLDYTIVMPKDWQYADLERILANFKADYLVDYNLASRFEDETAKKYTIRYTVGSYEKTLTFKELDSFKNQFITYLQKNGLTISD